MLFEPPYLTLILFYLIYLNPPFSSYQKCQLHGEAAMHMFWSTTLLHQNV